LLFEAAQHALTSELQVSAYLANCCGDVARCDRLCDHTVLVSDILIARTVERLRGKQLHLRHHRRKCLIEAWTPHAPNQRAVNREVSKHELTPGRIAHGLDRRDRFK
jgi:hypothetical protein